VERRPYGDTGLEVSALCYGAMTIRHDPDLKGGVAPSLLRALEGGVTLVDTARVYAGSEEIVAATLREWRGERPIVSTKLLPKARDTWREWRPLAEAYTPESIRASVEASLAALRVDALDIVHLHQWWAPWADEAELFDTLGALRREGKLRFAAISVGDHEHDAALEVVGRKGVAGVQLIVNLFESRPLSSLLPIAKKRGVGAIARCVYDSGGLSGALDEAGFRARPFLTHAPYAEYQARLAALRERFTPEPAATLPELALRFALSADGVSSVTVGMPTVAFVEDALRTAAKGPLPAEAIAEIRRHHVWTKNFYEKLA